MTNTLRQRAAPGQTPCVPKPTLRAYGLLEWISSPLFFKTIPIVFNAA